MSVVIRFKDDRLQQYIRGSSERMQGAIAEYQAEGGPVALEALRSNIPIRTGQMRESAFLHLTPKGFSIGVDHPAAGYVDQGTRPHTIFPRNAQVLRWFGPFGEPHFATHVHHPGFMGRQFIQKTRDFISIELRELWREILARVFGT